MDKNKEDELGVKGLLAGAFMWPLYYRWNCKACDLWFSDRRAAVAHATMHREQRAERRRIGAGVKNGKRKRSKGEVLSIIAMMVGLVCLLGPPGYLLVWWVESTDICGDQAGLYFPPGEAWKIWLLALAWFNAIPMFAASSWLGRDD